VTKKNTFSKEERLKSSALIGRLFKEGHSFAAYPMRVVWLPRGQTAATPVSAPAQVSFVAPKRLFKTAVARNRVKRLMREAYRIHKSEFYAVLQATDRRVVLMLMCIAKTPPVYAEVEAGIKKMIGKMKQVAAQTEGGA
jgi:ribonuclease P protein component